jgi:RNA polymerase sigma-70 factor, ECF subfamily
VVDDRTDAQLLAATAGEPEAFGVLYRRHLDWVLRVAVRRTGSPEHAADLTAETFAAALLASGRYRPELGAANNWLFGILLKKLAGFERRGAVEQRARRRLELETPVLSVAQFDRMIVAECDGPDVIGLLERLPVDQRRAVRERVIDERPYVEVAASLGVSEAGARKRVSRGLAALRIELRKEAP